MQDSAVPPSRIGRYSLYHPLQGSTLTYGTLYERKATLPFEIEPERMIRVWLPPGYEKGRNYKVIYFSDGQNLVDRALSAFGDWHLDRCIHSIMEEGYQGAILVGIDCPKNPHARADELNPPYRLKRGRKDQNPQANRYIEYIIHTLKTEIDATFHTLKDVSSTGIGGSSMGGIMAFYAYLRYKAHFGFALAFSIPTFFYSKPDWLAMIEEWGLDPSTDRRLALYVGGEGFEAKFHPGNIWLYEQLKNAGYDDHNLHFDVDAALPHHEEAWAKYAYEALRFLLGKA